MECQVIIFKEYYFLFKDDEVKTILLQIFGFIPVMMKLINYKIISVLLLLLND